MDLSSDKLNINNRKIKMQTDKKTISDEMFKSANAIHKVSRSGSLYGRLFAIKEMQIHLLQEENKIKKEIEREERT